MATTASGVVIPGNDPLNTPVFPIQDYWNNLGKSLSGMVIVDVASVTARAALITALTAEGYTPSATAPVYVHRVDAPAGFNLEYTVDGTTWITVGSAVTWLSGGDMLVAAGGTAVTPTAGFPAVAHTTRVIIGVEGVAGFNASASDVAVDIVGSLGQTQSTMHQVTAQAAKWATVSRSGYMDIPANTAATVAVVSVQSLPSCWFSMNMTLTRINI